MLCIWCELFKRESEDIDMILIILLINKSEWFIAFNKFPMEMNLQQTID
jgi:hypothetical protein